jgi:hypothetical protein
MLRAGARAAACLNRTLRVGSRSLVPVDPVVVQCPLSAFLAAWSAAPDPSAAAARHGPAEYSRRLFGVVVVRIARVYGTKGWRSGHLGTVAM